MNGSVLPNTPIAVDFWKLRECPQAKFFFLTHLHGDHSVGLTSSWQHDIYCSDITAKLLILKYDIPERLIKPLEIGTSCLIYLDKDRSTSMTVTPMDANHCPGAVMFLFQGYFGTILHTGDFRFCMEMVVEPPLSCYLGEIDTLYLDNTYCSPSCVFPSREEATQKIIDIIKKHPEHDVLIGLRNLGKEELLIKIAESLQEWVSVPGNIYKTFQVHGVPDMFKSNCSNCRIRVVRFHSISNRNIEKWNEIAPSIAILPTSLYCGLECSPFINQDKVFVVPYSDHSSYSELEEFVSYIRPRKIIPIVQGKSRGPFGVSLEDRADMTRFEKFLNKSECDHVIVPPAVKKLMSSSNVLVTDSACDKGLGVKRKPRGQLQSSKAKQQRKGVVFESQSPAKQPDEENKENDMNHRNSSEGCMESDEHAAEKGKSAQDIIGKNRKENDCILVKDELSENSFETNSQGLGTTKMQSGHLRVSAVEDQCIVIEDTPPSVLKDTDSVNIVVDKRGKLEVNWVVKEHSTCNKDHIQFIMQDSLSDNSEGMIEGEPDHCLRRTRCISVDRTNENGSKGKVNRLIMPDKDDSQEAKYLSDENESSQMSRYESAKEELFSKKVCADNEQSQNSCDTFETVPESQGFDVDPEDSLRSAETGGSYVEEGGSICDGSSSIYPEKKIICCGIEESENHEVIPKNIKYQNGTKGENSNTIITLDSQDSNSETPIARCHHVGGSGTDVCKHCVLKEMFYQSVESKGMTESSHHDENSVKLVQKSSKRREPTVCTVEDRSQSTLEGSMVIRIDSEDRKEIGEKNDKKTEGKMWTKEHAIGNINNKSVEMVDLNSDYSDSSDCESQVLIPTCRSKDSFMASTACVSKAFVPNFGNNENIRLALIDCESGDELSASTSVENIRITSSGSDKLPSSLPKTARKGDGKITSYLLAATTNKNNASLEQSKEENCCASNGLSTCIPGNNQLKNDSKGNYNTLCNPTSNRALRQGIAVEKPKERRLSLSELRKLIRTASRSGFDDGHCGYVLDDEAELEEAVSITPVRKLKEKHTIRNESVFLRTSSDPESLPAKRYKNNFSNDIEIVNIKPLNRLVH